jgi:two-component system nitrate/nitrite response regulator NarL
VRVLVADAQFLIRQGVVSLLQNAFADCSFLHAATLVQAKQALDADDRSAGIRLVICDLDLPGLNGGAGIRTLRQSCPAPRIAVLSGTDDWNTITHCLAAGVHGYLLKANAAEQLVPAVQTLVAGGVYVPPRVQQVRPVVAPTLAPMAELTTRQQEVLTLLLEGQSTKDIAKCLNLGVGTVKVHLGGIYRTLSVRNRAEAVARLRIEALS